MFSINAILGLFSRKDEDNNKKEPEIKIHVTPRGALYVDPDELMQSESAKRHIAAFRRAFEGRLPIKDSEVRHK